MASSVNVTPAELEEIVSLEIGELYVTSVHTEGSCKPVPSEYIGHFTDKVSVRLYTLDRHIDGCKWKFYDVMHTIDSDDEETPESHDKGVVIPMWLDSAKGVDKLTFPQKELNKRLSERKTVYIRRDREARYSWVIVDVNVFYRRPMDACDITIHLSAMRRWGLKL